MLSYASLHMGVESSLLVAIDEPFQIDVVYVCDPIMRVLNGHEFIIICLEDFVALYLIHLLQVGQQFVDVVGSVQLHPHHIHEVGVLGGGFDEVSSHHVGQRQHVVVLGEFVVAGQADVEVAGPIAEGYLIEHQGDHTAQVAGERIVAKMIDLQFMADGAQFAAAGQRSAADAENHFFGVYLILHAAIDADRIADVLFFADEAVEVACGVEEAAVGEDGAEVALVEVGQQVA